MTINEIIIILENKLSNLNQQKMIATKIGDLAQIEAFDIEITETQNTLDSLKLL